MGVKLGCILRCIYNNGGGPGGVESIDEASASARRDPSELSTEDRLALGSETFGYFFADRATTFSAAREGIWTRMSVSINGLPKDPPDWFTQKSRLIDIVCWAPELDESQGFVSPFRAVAALCVL